MRVHEVTLTIYRARVAHGDGALSELACAATFDGERREVTTRRSSNASQREVSFGDPMGAALTWRRSAARARVLARGDAVVKITCASRDGAVKHGFCVIPSGIGKDELGARTTASRSRSERWIPLRGATTATGSGDGRGVEVLVRVESRVLGSARDGGGDEDVVRQGVGREERRAAECEAKIDDVDDVDDVSDVVDDDEDDVDDDEDDEEANAVPFAIRRQPREPNAEVSGRLHAFALRVTLESFERAKIKGTSTASRFAANIGADDALANIIGLERARARCMVRTGSTRVMRGGDVAPFPDGAARVEFACAPATLAAALSRAPTIVLDLWAVNDESNVASAAIALDELVHAPEVRFRVEATNDAGDVVGFARVTARLDERGTLSSPATPRRGVTSIDAAVSPVPVPSTVKPPAPTAKAQTRHLVVGTSPERDRERDPRSGVEYKVAYDLEVWKHQHMNAFMDELRDKEAARMKILEDEWRVRETRRARDAEDAAQRAATMERKLKDAAHALEMRERKLVELEESIEHRKNKLERDAARAQDEARDVVRRNVESSEHRVEMEKHKAKEAIRERDALHRRLEHAEARVIEIEGAFAAHKKAQLETSEAALQAELARLTPRCEAAEARALEESQSKERYKGQLTKMARQVVALERERTHLRRAIDRAGINISSRAHAAPSANEFISEMLAGEGAESDAFMASFRADVNAVAAGGAFQSASYVQPLKTSRPSKPLTTSTVFGDDHPSRGAMRAEDGDFNHVENFAPIRHTSNAASLQEIRAAEKEVRRLVTERGDLMRTGMYSSGDKIISMIDARIEELTDRIASV